MYRRDADIGQVHAHLRQSVFFYIPADGFHGLAGTRNAHRFSAGVFGT